MGAYVEQTRLVPYKDWYYSTNTNPSVRHATHLGPRSQKTRSYRSGASLASSGLEDKALDGVANQTQAYQRFALERRGAPQSSYDNGHEFYTEGTRVDSCPEAHYSFSGNQLSTVPLERLYRYSGPMFLDPASPAGGHGMYPTISLLPSYSINQSTVDGVKAVNATVPTKSPGDLAVSLAELMREGIPHAMGSTLRQFKDFLKDPFGNLGDEHLNAQFGWKPIVSETLATVRALKKSNQLIRQFERDSGRLVRRRFSFPEETNTTYQMHPTGGNLYTSGMGSPYFVQSFQATTNQPLSEVHRTSVRKWFSGAYTYYFETALSSRRDLVGYERRADALLGTRVTPEVLWNLQPWSWLADWKANIGSNIANATHFSEHSLVMKYGYLMVSREISCTRVGGPWQLKNGQGSVGPLELTTSRYRKERFKATPYGFGIDTGSFNLFQWSILGALGLTKAPTSLRGS